MHTKDKKNPDMLHMRYFMQAPGRLFMGVRDQFEVMRKQSVSG